MLATVGAIAFVLLIIVLAIWSGRDSDSGSNNGSNRAKANYYGGG